MGLLLCKQLLKIQTGPLTAYGDISVLSVPSMGCVQSKEEIDFEETKALLLHSIAEAEKEIKTREESSAEKEKEKGPRSEHAATSGRDFNVQDLVWPDPDPGVTKSLAVDDVTRLNSTEVERIFFVRNSGDVQRVLSQARAEGRSVSMRGTQHSMGGQSIAPGGFVIDMARLNKMELNPATGTVTVGPGVLWSQLVLYLNQFGLSPQTLQSYSTFSVGGSLSVNAHGITSDQSVQDSVVSLTVVRWDGAVTFCSPEVEKELFSLVLGGYGMFGVMVEVELKVQDNAHLWMELIECTTEEFPLMYGSLLEDKSVDIKLGRIDTVKGESCQLFVFKKTRSREGVRTVSSVPLEPREMSATSQLLYKWLLPAGKNLRSTLENLTGQALDWSDANERNLLIYESCLPLAKMFTPLHTIDHTFVLQEFFVPKGRFTAWMHASKSILTARYKKVTLLNCTVRFVFEDKTTLLSYSRDKEGSFAFVLYYRVVRNSDGDKELAQIHDKLTKVTLDCSGTFYLPYRHHYTKEQLLQAYPRIEEFFQKKNKYDPHKLFSSAWSEHYMPLVLPSQEWAPLPQQDPPNESAVVAMKDVKIVSEHRDDSYRRLMSDPTIRDSFFEQFFTNIFNIESKAKIQSLVAKALSDPRNKSDIDVYECLKKNLEAQDGPLNQISKVWKGIQQNRRQKKELTGETVKILHRLHRLGRIDGFVSVGDTGKLVRPLVESGFVKGKVWVVHDSLGDLPQMIERGTQDEVGEFVHIDYSNPIKLAIPSDSADLVTLNQGLHHWPQSCLLPFLNEVFRVLRPRGLFVVREHDCSPELLPVLDLAHSIFNAVNGISVVEERTEIRAFRSILEWREIIESVGFQDTLLYDMEKGDPTIDEMMCFSKGSPLTKSEAEKIVINAPHSTALHTLSRPTFAGVLPDQMSQGLRSLADQGPDLILETARIQVARVIDGLTGALNQVKGLGKDLSPGQQFLVSEVGEQLINPMLDLLLAFQPYLSEAQSKKADFELIPDEVIVLICGLLKKADSGKASAGELALVSVIKDVKNFLSSEDQQSSNEPTMVASFTSQEVLLTMKKLLKAQPELADPEYLLTTVGLPRQLVEKLQAAGTGQIDSENVSELLFPYLDSTSWSRLKLALEEITNNPIENKFSLSAVKKKDTAWHRATVALLGSPRVQLTTTAQTLASLAGLGDLVVLWRQAQEERVADDKKEVRETFALTNQTEKMLETAVELLGAGKEREEEALGALIRCLKIAGLLKKGGRDEFTWYKLVEWLQVGKQSF